ncbi:transmembrane protein 79-like protein [Lates japonicus]|uniref:Transmembrane protein 79-like protein n=1 Tax=Lates japonicus TaxID=270547 RepID=A0AAD3R8M2_LATJO|nr:transmembrane protein 79-like protein [Lates japonicus]
MLIPWITFGGKRQDEQQFGKPQAAVRDVADTHAKESVYSLKPNRGFLEGANLREVVQAEGRSRPRRLHVAPGRGRRGRPRQQPAKRGRPRKYPLPSPEELKKPKVWKPLGRPRKYPRVDPPEGAPPVPRRSRGRPRKSESKKGAHLRKSLPTTPSSPRNPNDGPPRKRGRPPSTAKTEDVTPRKRGRPKGSVNKNKARSETQLDSTLANHSKEKSDSSAVGVEHEGEPVEEEVEEDTPTEHSDHTEVLIEQDAGFEVEVEVGPLGSRDYDEGVTSNSTKELPEESRLFIEKDDEREPQVEPVSAMQYYPEWMEQDDKYYMCEHLCSEKLRLALATAAAALLFPLLVWGGYKLLPFDSPLLESAPLRVVYTLRCAFFATIPILLGVVVQGIARLRYSALKPLYQSKLVDREVAVHWHYVNESVGLFLFYFLQLTVMATYVSQEMVKLVPLLTIIFVFGRLIYWLCLSLGSTIRGLGFGFSFLPILVMLGANFYYVCSSVGQGSVFDIAPPTTAPPPRQRWWG